MTETEQKLLTRATKALRSVFSSVYMSGREVVFPHRGYSYNEDDVRLINTILKQEFPFEMQWFEPSYLKHVGGGNYLPVVRLKD